jgi:DNA-binding beta-propeller fold protein YncE
MKKEYYFCLSIISLATTFVYSIVSYGGNLVFAGEPEKYLFSMKMGSIGTCDGEFDTPHTIAFDLSGNMYVTDTKNDRVQKFDSNGTFLSKWGERSTSDDQFIELK